MYRVTKRMEVAGSHSLNLRYPSKCENLHGHNWVILVTCEATSLNDDGMVVDFTDIKKAVHDRLDHKHLNDVLPFNPTAENIARWVCENVPNCVKVEVQESEGNVAIYERLDLMHLQGMTEALSVIEAVGTRKSGCSCSGSHRA